MHLSMLLLRENEIKKVGPLDEILDFCVAIKYVDLDKNPVCSNSGEMRKLKSKYTGAHATLMQIQRYSCSRCFEFPLLEEWLAFRHSVDVNRLIAFASRCIQRTSMGIVSKLFPEVDRLVGEMLLKRE